jgi:cytosine deaminase
MVLMGRHDTYPKRRGMTRVPELMAAGLTVALGQDSAMDPWYGLGSGDMLDVAHMAVHVAQMTGLDAMAACFAAVTEGAARLLHLEDYGLAPGCRADMVLLDAHDPVEAIRLRATRLKVIRQGKVIAEAPMQRSLLALPGRPDEVSFLWPPPKPGLIEIAGRSRLLDYPAIGPA